MWAGKNTAVAKREGYFFEVVPPIYPVAPGMFKRAIAIEGLNLQSITPFAIELHDIIITKLGRYHARDRSDIELLTRIPGFQRFPPVFRRSDRHQPTRGVIPGYQRNLV